MDKELINALATLRDLARKHSDELQDAVDILDNAGVFAAVDEAAEYNVRSRNLWSLEDCFSEEGWYEIGRQELGWWLKNHS